VEDVGGDAGIDDANVAAVVNDVGRVLGGPWCSASAATMGRGEKASATGGGELFPQRGDVAQKRKVYKNDRQQKVVKGC